jgi:hypothetical protein
MSVLICLYITSNSESHTSFILSVVYYKIKQSSIWEDPYKYVLNTLIVSLHSSAESDVAYLLSFLVESDFVCFMSWEIRWFSFAVLRFELRASPLIDKHSGVTLPALHIFLFFWKHWGLNSGPHCLSYSTSPRHSLDFTLLSFWYATFICLKLTDALSLWTFFEIQQGYIYKPPKIFQMEHQSLT